MAVYLPWFNGWADFTPTTPKMYWEVKSQEQRIHHMCCEIHKLVCYSDEQTRLINGNTDDIKKLLADFETFKEKGFLDYYEQLLYQWLMANGPHVIESLLGFSVFFGLTDDGYFTAYSPESWRDMSFDTGAVYGADDYGRLILEY